MKEVMLFILKNCPYCIEAIEWQRELVRENPDYAKIDIEVIEENIEKARADSYDYYYVPTYYVGGVKLHEGAATKEKIRAVLDAALGE